MNRTFLAIGAVALLGAGGYLTWQSTRPAPTPVAASSTAIAPAAGAAAASTDVDLSRVIEMAVGNPDAPVTIIEYASFTCPHCANFSQGVYQQIRQNYIDTGVVRFIKREVYFDAYGLWAALVARCGGPERYHGIAEMIYQTQREWTASQDGAVVAENLRRIGRRAGMNDAELNACLTDRDMATALMEVYRRNATADNVRATPSFIINGRPYSNMSYAEFETAIAAARGN